MRSLPAGQRKCRKLTNRCLPPFGNNLHHWIGAAAIVPHNAIADSLMDEISTFVEENTEPEILDELREIR
jgi:hypothetical protein